MAALRLGRFRTGPVGTGELLTGHAADTRRSSMRDRIRPASGKDGADPCGGRHARRRAWPAPPSAQPRHGIGRASAAGRGGEQA
jgi:hypothetical protein